MNDSTNNKHMTKGKKLMMEMWNEGEKVPQKKVAADKKQMSKTTKEN